jgi:hypothetical protein
MKIVVTSSFSAIFDVRMAVLLKILSLLVCYIVSLDKYLATFRRWCLELQG